MIKCFETFKKCQSFYTNIRGTKKKGGHPILLIKEQERMPNIAERYNVLKLCKKCQSFYANI